MIKDKSIYIKNIYYMLSYAFKALRQEEYKNINTEKFENIHNLFASILSIGVGKQLKQGLYKEYINKNENLSLARGKINITNTIKNMLERKRVLSCDFDELSENNLLNQILKTSIIILLKHSNVKEEYKSILKKEILFLSNVDEIETQNIKWNKIKYNRNNISYQMLIGICELLLRGMLPTTDSGEMELSSFIDDQQMYNLYEKFILGYYQTEYKDLNAIAAQVQWKIDDDNRKFLPDMQTDITLSKENNVLIIDAKYYNDIFQQQYNKSTLRSNNLYQIFTYVKNEDAKYENIPHRVSGMLLYASTDEIIQPDNSYKMSGNIISVKTLDLNKDFSEISKKLNLIVDEYFA